MLWQPVSFQSPETILAVAEGLVAVLAAAQAAMESGSGALDGLGLPDEEPESGGADEARAQASGVLSERASYIAVTPYQHGVGTRRGENSYLTPQGAIEAIGARLVAASAEAIASGEIPSLDSGLVLLVMATAEPGQLASALGEFNDVYPIPELQQAERRAKSLSTFERDKFVVPSAPGYPSWGSASPDRSATGRATSRALGGQIAVAEGMEAAQASPTGRLAAFRQKRTAAAQERQQAMDDLSASMSGQNDAWFGVYLEGLVAEMAPLLARFAPPLDASFKCCAAVCWYGTKSQVSYYKEAFGLQNPLEGIL